MATSLWSPFFHLFNRYRLCLGSYYRTPSRGRSTKDRVAPDFYQFHCIWLWAYPILFALVFSGGTLGFESFRFGAFGQKVALGYLRFLSLGIIPLLLFSVVPPSLMHLATRLSMYLMLFGPTSQWFLQFPPHLWNCWSTRVEEPGQVWELPEWLIGPLLLISIAVIQKDKRLSPTTLKKFPTPRIKVLYPTHLKLGLPYWWNSLCGGCYLLRCWSGCVQISVPGDC